MKTTFIYALCEPDLQVPVIRYIGKTVRLKRRFRDHCNHSFKASTHLGCWLRSLKARSEIPVLMTLTEVPEEIGSAAEILYIRLARENGMDLVNATDGGDGVTMTPQIRKKISDKNKGRIASEEARANMSAAKQGPEHRGVNHSCFGRTRSEETKIKLRAWVRLGDSEETKARKSESALKAWAKRKGANV